VTSALICGGKKDVRSQEATLRNRPDVVVSGALDLFLSVFSSELCAGAVLVTISAVYYCTQEKYKITVYTCQYLHLHFSFKVLTHIAHSFLTQICTPGRMLDHLRNSPSVNLDDLDVLVLDEADRLLDLGFQVRCVVLFVCIWLCICYFCCMQQCDMVRMLN